MTRRLVALALALFTLPLFGASIVFNAEVPVAPAEYGATPGRDAQVATNGSIFAATWTDSRVLNLAAYVTRFREDGSVIDGGGIPIPGSRFAGAILWTGRAFLVTYVDMNRTAMARTLSLDGVLGEPVELFGIFYVGENKLRMATNGENVLIVSSQGTAAILDFEGRNLRQFPMPWEVAYSLDVAAAGSTYLVAGSDHNAKVITQIVNGDGSLGASRSFAGSGVAVASDGNRFLLAWGTDELHAQLVSREGELLGTARTLADADVAVVPVNAVWRGGEYLIGFHTYPQSSVVRVNSEGELTGNVVTIDLGALIRDGIFGGGPLMDIAVADGEGVVVGGGGTEGIVAAFFDAQSITAPAPLQNAKRITNAARAQSHVRLARNGNGIVAGWLERTPPPAPSQIRISAGAGSPPVIVAADAQAIVDVVVESGVVWVVWFAQGDLYTRRYTASLQPIDAAPQKIHDAHESFQADASVAAGGGVVAVVFNVAGDAFTSDAYVEAYLLRSTPLTVDVVHTLVSHDQGRDHDVAVAYDGNAFVVVWANAPTFYSHRPRYDLDDDILTTRMTTVGTVLSAPQTVAHSKAVRTLAAARGASGVAAAWQTTETGTYTAYVDEKVVRNLGGDGLLLGSFAAHDGGFLLARGSIGDLQKSPVAELEVVTLDSTLAAISTAKLPPFEIDPFWHYYGFSESFDADLLGGASPVLAYSRVADEFGGVSRLFTRGLREAVRRRAVR